MRPDLVLIHGWGMTPAVWDALPDALTGAFSIHRIPLPGHGGAPWSAPTGTGARTLDAWAQACLDSAPPRAVWLGWSLGGLVALAAALKAPHRVHGLILVTATPRFCQGPDWAPAMPFETLERFGEGLAADPGGTLERFLALQVRGSDRGLEVLRRLRGGLRSSPPTHPQALDIGLGLLREGDLRGDLRGLGCPNLWVFGERDTLVPPAVAAEIPSLAPGAEALVVQGAAHAPFVSHPEATARSILEFVQGLSA